MRAYYYDNLPGDPSLPHEGTPAAITILTSLGILQYSIPIDADGAWQTKVARIAGERGYKHQDFKESSREKMGDNYEEARAVVWKEHMHEDEEIRYPVAGSAYFDVREHSSDSWIRIHVEAGDLVVLPAGIYHRFTMDAKGYVNMMRLFKDEPKWQAHYRNAETDRNPRRVEYVQSLQAGSESALVSVVG